MKQMTVGVVVRCYACLLRLYPRRHHKEFSGEMVAVFAASAEEAGRDGAGALTALCLKELAEFPINLAEIYWLELACWEVAMNRKLSWTVWPLWIVSHLFSIPVAMLIMLAVIAIVPGIVGLSQDLSRLVPFALLPALGATTGVLQWVLLRRHLQRGTPWIIVTVLGWLVGLFLGYLGWLLAKILGYSEQPVAVAGIVLPSFGVAVGVTQYLVLRRVVARAGWWVVANTLGYGALILTVTGPITSILEAVFLISLPALITGLALVLLFRQRGETEPLPVKRDVPADDTLPMKGTRRWLRTIVVSLALLLFFLVAPWVWTVGQLTLAKADGIYATPEEGMTARMMAKGSGGYEVERVEILFAGTNSFDGSLPHVWFVGANAYTDYRPDGKSTAPRGYYSAGSFFVRVEDGWVHVSEGAFPAFMGLVMEWYGLEGCHR
jgi:hypothetical protein